ncbi:MAG: hypothetical protein ABDK94_10450 [Atribacterota bacterium]
MESNEKKVFRLEGSDVVVVIRDGRVDRVMCDDPLINVTVINFGQGQEGFFHEARMFFYPLNEWDRFELQEIVEEYNQRYQYGRHIPGNNQVSLGTEEGELPRSDDYDWAQVDPHQSPPLFGEEVYNPGKSCDE